MKYNGATTNMSFHLKRHRPALSQTHGNCRFIKKYLKTMDTNWHGCFQLDTPYLDTYRES
jgi:hypothetical protein